MKNLILLILLQPLMMVGQGVKPVHVLETHKCEWCGQESQGIMIAFGDIQNWICNKCFYDFNHPQAEPCDHRFVMIATPDTGRDSVLIVSALGVYSDPGYTYDWDTHSYLIPVKAESPCICVKCHKEERCY
jgi:hypothetical protein